MQHDARGYFRTRFLRCAGFAVGTLVACLAPTTAPADILELEVVDQLDNGPAATSGPLTIESDSGNFSLDAVPLPIVDPTLGTGAALVGLATFRLDPEDTTSPRSTAVVAYARTSKGNEIFGAGGTFFFDADRFRADFLAGAAELNLDFYGLGDGVLARNPIPFRIDGRIARLGAAVRVVPNTYLGIRGTYADTHVGLNGTRPIPGNQDLNVELRGLGPFVQYDNRDSTWYPESGTQAQLAINRFDAILPWQDGFDTFDGFVSHYADLGDSMVFAGRLRLAHAGDGAPFFLYPYVGLRGFPALRYLDRTVGQAEAELRMRPFRTERGFMSKLGVVVFAGAGFAAQDLSGLRDAPIAYAGGVGMRYRVSETDGINVGVDVAWGRGNESGVYFRIGEAF